MGDDAASQFREYAGIEKGHVDKIVNKGRPADKPDVGSEPKPAAKKAPAKKAAAKKPAAKAKAK